MKKVLLPPTIVAISCVLFFVLIFPGYQAVKMTRAKIKETEVILAERKAEVDNFKAVAKQYQSQKVNMEKISVFLPRIKQIDELVMTIKTASDQNGLQLNGLSIAGANEAGATR